MDTEKTYTLHLESPTCGIFDCEQPRCVKDAKEAWDKFSGVLGLISAKGRKLELADLRTFTQQLIKISDIKSETKKKK